MTVVEIPAGRWKSTLHIERNVHWTQMLPVRQPASSPWSPSHGKYNVRHSTAIIANIGYTFGDRSHLVSPALSMEGTVAEERRSGILRAISHRLAARCQQSVHWPLCSFGPMQGLRACSWRYFRVRSTSFWSGLSHLSLLYVWYSTTIGRWTAIAQVTSMRGTCDWTFWKVCERTGILRHFQNWGCLYKAWSCSRSRDERAEIREREHRRASEEETCAVYEPVSSTETVPSPFWIILNL